MAEWAYHEHFAGAVIDNTTRKAMEYRNLIKSEKHQVIWERLLANKIGRLAQGIRDVKGTNTFTFIPKSDIPKDRL